MDWLPPIEVSRISDGGKVRPHKELSDPHSVRLFSKIWFFSFLFESSYRKPAFLILLPSFIELEGSIGGPPVMHCMKEPFFV